MAMYISRKKGGVTPTSITPSNSTPASLTSGSAVTPTANGYAVESITNVTPSNSSPASLSAGDIVKISSGQSGYAVEQVQYKLPSNTPESVSQYDVVRFNDDGVIVNYLNNVKPSNTSIPSLGMYDNCRITGNGYAVASVVDKAPSDTSPPAISDLAIIRARGAGYLYATQQSSPTSITPSNSSPVALTANTPVNPTSSGYAIQSYSSKTPSDSSPASVSSGAIIKASSAGYLYASSGLGKCKAGTFTSSTSAQTINLGFQPKYIMVMSETRTTNIFDYSYSSTKGVYAASSAYPTEYTISGNTSNNRISAISSTGFTFNKSGSSGATMYYFAMA